MSSGSPSDKSQNVKSYSGADKRYLPRWEVNSRVLYKSKGDPLSRECRSRDLNCAGTSIYTDDELATNESVQLVIYLDSDVTVRVEGRVVWKKQEQGQNVFGINFEQMSKKTQDLILKYAFELNREILVNHWFKGWEKSK